MNSVRMQLVKNYRRDDGRRRCYSSSRTCLSLPNYWFGLLAKKKVKIIEDKIGQPPYKDKKLLSMCPLLRGTAIQWNPSKKDTLKQGHLSNKDTFCSPNDNINVQNYP